MPNQHYDRRSLRLAGHDYSGKGAYFVTICANGRDPIFGTIKRHGVLLSEIGLTADEEWIRTGLMREEVTLDEYVIMPNHMHAVVWITERHQSREGDVGAHSNAPLPKRHPHSLGSIVSGFKGAVTRRAREITSEPSLVVWQRNYYERVVRNERQLNALRRYIRLNPERWILDEYHVD